MYQKTIVVGNVGRDGEMRFTPSGVPVTEFSVAVNIGYGDKKKTQWWSITAWNKLAETCGQYVKKGMRVLVDGHAEMQEWESEGQHKSKLVLVADNVRFLSSRGETNEPQDIPVDDGSGELPF